MHINLPNIFASAENKMLFLRDRVYKDKSDGSGTIQSWLQAIQYKTISQKQFLGIKSNY